MRYLPFAGAPTAVSRSAGSDRTVLRRKYESGTMKRSPTTSVCPELCAPAGSPPKQSTSRNAAA